MWRRYFKLKLVPGVVITRQFGRVDFRNDNLKVEDLQRLYEEDFPYLELTDEGKKELYGIGIEPESINIPEIDADKFEEPAPVMVKTQRGKNMRRSFFP